MGLTDAVVTLSVQPEEIMQLLFSTKWCVKCKIYVEVNSTEQVVEKIGFQWSIIQQLNLMKLSKRSIMFS